MLNKKKAEFSDKYFAGVDVRGKKFQPPKPFFSISLGNILAFNFKGSGVFLMM